MGPKTVFLIAGLGTFILVIGAIVRLVIAHDDPTALIQFLTTVAVPSIPAAASWYVGTKAKNHAEGAKVAAAGALEHAEGAEAAANQAEANTNGKLDAKFRELHSAVRQLNIKIDEHLSLHDLRGK